MEVLYEDAAVIAVNKPAGVTVHAGAGQSSGTLVNRLVHRFASLSQLGGELRPGIVHRLDKDTSGVLLVARTDAAHRALAAQFAGRSVEKTYLALVHGRVKAESGRITKPIARDPVRRTRMTARLGSGREALTEYRVRQRFEKLTLLEVRIGTGRTHQIRVHLASIGHPVAGDRLYGAPAARRMFLHAWRIGFESPATGARVAVEAPAVELGELAGIGSRSYNRDVMKYPATALLVLLLVAAGAIAQAPQTPPAPETFTSDQPITLDVTRVNILFTVTDRKGRFVKDLTKEDFEITENKKRQTILEFTAESDLPLRIALLIDTSNSVRDGSGSCRMRLTNSSIRPCGRSWIAEWW